MPICEKCGGKGYPVTDYIRQLEINLEAVRDWAAINARQRDEALECLKAVTKERDEWRTRVAELKVTRIGDDDPLGIRGVVLGGDVPSLASEVYFLERNRASDKDSFEVGVCGDRCEPGNECGRTGCPNCQK